MNVRANPSADYQPDQPDRAVAVRGAEPADIATVMRLKMDFAREEGSLEALCASPDDWRRDLFGPVPRFTALLAERAGATAGLLIYAEKFCPGWVGPLVSVHDVYVEPQHRRCGVATALLGRVARHAVVNGAACVELNVHADNPARRLYSHVGFQHLRHCLTYVIAGTALVQLAATAADLLM